MNKIKKYFVIVSVGIVILVSLFGGAVSDRLFGYRLLDKFFPPRKTDSLKIPSQTQRIIYEESVVIDVAERVSPSVVTIGISKTQQQVTLPGFGELPFFFGFPQLPPNQQKVEQDIATGFIITQDGLIVTNKHVVADTQAKYKVITKDDKTYEVKKIYRDPANDIAILKVDPSTSFDATQDRRSGQALKPVEMGDSSKLKVGQFVIAIGTALGEFRDTVTTGVVSGIGRSITAGSPLEGYVERLDDVIQTSAAINPGNSGGPLLNSAGQVIGINVAVAAEGQNVGFALPINIVKESIDNFNKTGQFSRPFLGVRYRIISREVAILNEVPEGAFVQEVVVGSPAERVGIRPGDILTHLDGQRITDANGGLAKLISGKKVGDRVEITLWRDGKEQKTTATLIESEG